MAKKITTADAFKQAPTITDPDSPEAEAAVKESLGSPGSSLARGLAMTKVPKSQQDQVALTRFLNDWDARHESSGRVIPMKHR